MWWSVSYLAVHYILRIQNVILRLKEKLNKCSMHKELMFDSKIFRILSAIITKKAVITFRDSTSAKGN